MILLPMVLSFFNQNNGYRIICAGDLKKSHTNSYLVNAVAGPVCGDYDFAPHDSVFL
jgi:hypothetical protein